VGAREAAPQAEGAQAPPAAASPAREREALRADQSVLKQRAEKKLGAAAPEPEASNQAAPPAHVMQVKTLANGEQVPVGPATPMPFARPPLEAKGGFKKPAAQPLGAGAEEQREVAATSGAALDASRDRMAATSPAAPAPELEKSEASAEAALTTRLCGEVRDDRGRPIAGAAITLTGTGAGATSDAEGGFCVGAPATPATLQVLAVGYRSFRRSLAAADLARPVAVTLRSAEALPSAGYLAGTRAEPPRDPAAWAAALEATRAAARDSSATLWGRAAERWAAAAASAGGPQGADEARFHVAEARVRAWRLGRTEPQRRAAIDAVEAYLAAGGTDPLHELGQRWRRELSP